MNRYQWWLKYWRISKLFERIQELIFCINKRNSKEDEDKKAEKKEEQQNGEIIILKVFSNVSIREEIWKISLIEAITKIRAYKPNKSQRPTFRQTRENLSNNTMLMAVVMFIANLCLLFEFVNI